MLQDLALRQRLHIVLHARPSNELETATYAKLPTDTQPDTTKYQHVANNEGCILTVPDVHWHVPERLVESCQLAD